MFFLKDRFPEINKSSHYIIRFTLNNNSVWSNLTGFIYTRTHIVSFGIFTTSNTKKIVNAELKTIFTPDNNPYGYQSDPSRLSWNISEDHSYADLKVDADHFDIYLSGYANTNNSFVITEEDWYDDPESES